MANLTTQTAKINVVISLKDVEIGRVITRLDKYCNDNMDVFAYILHDKDVLEDGTLKTPHIHLVGTLLQKNRRLSSTLLDLANNLEINTFAITIDKMSDIVGSLQYLIHKNNPDKYQYDRCLIKTNITDGELSCYLSSDSKSISIEYLIGVISTNRNKIDIMRAIGLTYYHLYRNTINDIYNEIWQDVYDRMRDHK